MKCPANFRLPDVFISLLCLVSGMTLKCHHHTCSNVMKNVADKRFE